ncbi:N-formylglutamate amidohydrolase [Tistlia consotensis]|uniref:N-formylglutamate amidohydrolase n=1 Tax=Tistlia consotensis USBA 355 TaxID=560819 RepID=A0A1Y6BM39_9PROT|nr:N-formylglutamate amidohydrolase [Tistlia consotensis]SMF18997.1 N-formylglutamate amidohydrolase [Tistlia consotensis USBA 355]SNR39260.1 N-formylglutamate amidohydrolase [Tistlia consotensis]
MSRAAAHPAAHPAYDLHQPDEAGPLVLDSPHSGSWFPEDMGSLLSTETLLRGRDAYIDELYGAAPEQGAPLLAARFSRVYIDPNRAPEDLDPAMVEGTWPHPTQAGPKTGRGVGLIWSRIEGRQAIYDRKLTVAEVEARIESCWRPYHTALKGLLDDAHRRHGAVWHIDCHSMPSQGDPTTEDGPVARPEIILGDRDGTTCDPALTRRVAEIFEALGYEVVLNWPYKGVELVRRYSAPAEGRHSLQIEINRALYCDEASFERSPGFAKVRADCTTLIAELGDFARRRAAA